jgi:hypothetical protein
MSSEAICTSCGQDRVLGGFISVAADYDLKIYQCEGCLTHTWLVSKKSASNLQCKAPPCGTSAGRQARATGAITIQ